MFAKYAILLGLVFLAPSGAAAQDLLPLEHVVVFNNNGRQPPNPSVYPVFRLSERFALVEDFYTPANLDVSIVDNLRRSKLLYIGQYSDESPLFAEPDLCRAIRAHLERGGMLFFDYHTGSDGKRFRPETEAFLKSVDVSPPAEFSPGYGTSQFGTVDDHVMLVRPVALGAKSLGHYGWWQKWSPRQIVLAYDSEDSGRATLIAQQGVAGKGMVVFSQLPSLFRSPNGVAFDLARNLIAHAYAEGSPSP